MRIFNLTDKPVRVNTDVDGFQDARAKEERLSGLIPARSAWPMSGSVYVESGFALTNALTFRFDSPLGRPTTRVSCSLVSALYDGDARGRQGALYAYSAVYNSPLIGTQSCVDVFVSDQSIDPESWMSGIRDGADLAELLIPGTHDSATYSTDIPFATTQILDIRSQLETGIRYFDLRGGPYLIGPDDRGNPRYEVFAFHGPYNLGVRWIDLFDDMIAFLKKHPEEAILAQVKMDSGADSIGNDRLRDIVRRNRDFFYIENQIPTLREARGKIVIVNRMAGADLGFAVAAWDDYAGPRYRVQDRWSQSILAKPGIVKDFFDTQARSARQPAGIDRLNINFLSNSEAPWRTPFQSALGVVWSVDLPNLSPLEGINHQIAEFFTQYGGPFPSFQSVMLMDAAGARGYPDGLVTLAYMLNFRRFAKGGDAPEAGRIYYLRPKLDPEQVLAVRGMLPGNLGFREVAACRRQSGDGSSPWQRFQLESAGDGVYYLRVPLPPEAGFYCLTRSITGGQRLGVTNASRTAWKLTRYGQSDYYTISMVNGPLLTLTGRVDDNVIPVELTGTGTAPDRQLWLLDRFDPGD